MVSILPTQIIEGNGFFICYNKGDKKVQAKTTLVDQRMEQFYCLEGDHREGYKKLIKKGFSACLDYFEVEKNKKQAA